MDYYIRIRNLREDRNLTQQYIANVLHIAQRTYSDYETGRTRVPIESLIILAKFYNVSMDYITGVSSVETPFPTK